MYITISPQKTGGNYRGSVKDLVNYLDKEDHGKDPIDHELYFNQEETDIPSERVIDAIDANTAKLGKKDPKYYSLVISPSKGELRHIGDSPEKLKAYVRELMKDYAASFYRDKEVRIKDILYFAKLEHGRNYSEKDREVRENQAFASKILALKHQLRAMDRGEEQGDPGKIKKQIEALETAAPHQLHGKRIVPGMSKEGSQSHIHIIVSRRDVGNAQSLSPGSKFRRSRTQLNGRTIKQGFDRDAFYRSAERTFDKQFRFKRNFVESYQGRNLLEKDPKRFFATILGLPQNERQAARLLLYKAGVNVPAVALKGNQWALLALRRMKRAATRAMASGSIEV